MGISLVCVECRSIDKGPQQYIVQTNPVNSSAPVATTQVDYYLSIHKLAMFFSF